MFYLCFYLFWLQTSDARLFELSQLRLVVIPSVEDLVRDVSFLMEDQYSNVVVLDVENCKNIDSALFADVVGTMANVRVLKLIGSNIKPHSLLQISKVNEKIRVISMKHCEKFLFSVAHCCVWNFRELRYLELEIKYPKLENKEWRKMLRNFSQRVQFDDDMHAVLHYWFRWLQHEPNEYTPFWQLFSEE